MTRVAEATAGYPWGQRSRPGVYRQCASRGLHAEEVFMAMIRVVLR